MKAIGRARVPMPAGQPTITDYVLEEVIWCAMCRRRRQPAPAADSTRFYGCEPGCPQPPTEALPVEQDALLAAYLRATFVLHGIGRPSPVISYAAEPEHWRNNGDAPAVSGEELRRWQLCPITNRRAVLRTAFTRIDIDADGDVHMVWRRHTDTAEAAIS